MDCQLPKDKDAGDGDGPDSEKKEDDGQLKLGLKLLDPDSSG